MSVSVYLSLEEAPREKTPSLGRTRADLATTDTDRVSQRAGQVDEAEKEEKLWKKVEEGLLCLQHPQNAGPLLSMCSDLSQRQGCILG